MIRQGAKLVTCADDVIEELPTPVRAALVQAEKPEADQRNLLAADGLNGSEKKLYELLCAEEPVHIDELVERSPLELFPSSGYAVHLGDERDCSAVAGEAVLQGVVIEGDSGRVVARRATRHLRVRNR